jgi:Fungal chitosanase of glycosyl hydrolase group 75
VLPGRIGLGAKLDDFAVVIRPSTGPYDYAVYADVGPASKIGEGSIALAAALGVSSSPKTGGVGDGIVYIVFSGSAGKWTLSQQEIDQHAAQLFAKWGGVDKAKDCFPNLEWGS